MLSNLVANLAVEAADIHHGEPADPLTHLWPFVLPVAQLSIFFFPFPSFLRELFTSVSGGGDSSPVNHFPRRLIQR